MQMKYALIFIYIFSGFSHTLSHLSPNYDSTIVTFTSEFQFINSSRGIKLGFEKEKKKENLWTTATFLAYDSLKSGKTNPTICFKILFFVTISLHKNLLYKDTFSLTIANIYLVLADK